VLGLQTGGIFQRRITAVCATFQDHCSYEIILHLNLYTPTHTRTFIDVQDAHCFNNVLPVTYISCYRFDVFQ